MKGTNTMLGHIVNQPEANPADSLAEALRAALASNPGYTVGEILGESCALAGESLDFINDVDLVQAVYTWAAI